MDGVEGQLSGESAREVQLLVLVCVAALAVPAWLHQRYQDKRRAPASR